MARKFGFSTDDLDRLRDLVPRLGCSLGPRSLLIGPGSAWASFGQNTWAAGLDRLLLGVTMDETDQHFIGTALPLDDVDACDVDLVGRLAELLARLRLLIAAL